MSERRRRVGRVGVEKVGFGVAFALAGPFGVAEKTVPPEVPPERPADLGVVFVEGERSLFDPAETREERSGMVRETTLDGVRGG